MKKLLFLILFVSIYKLSICQRYFNEYTYLDDIELNMPYIIDDINYRDYCMYRSKEYTKSLHNLLNILSINKSIKAIILVYTDNVGSPRYNLRLTERYSKQVKEYLCNLDTTPQNRIITFGYSGRIPIASNYTKEGRRYNRRTEVIFVDTEKTIIQTDTTSHERKNKICGNFKKRS